MNHERPEIVQEGELKAFSPDGVDLTLIRWMLSLTPEQRLEVLQSNVNSILWLREQVSKKSHDKPTL